MQQKQKQKQSNLGTTSRLHPYLALANTHFHKELEEKKQALPYVPELSKSGLLNSRNWQILQVQSPKKDARQILPSPAPKRLQFSAFHSLHLSQKGCISACIELQTYSVSAQSCYCSFTPARLSMALLPVMLTNHFCPVLKTSQFLGVLSLPLNWRQRE